MNSYPSPATGPVMSAIPVPILYVPAATQDTNINITHTARIFTIGDEAPIYYKTELEGQKIGALQITFFKQASSFISPGDLVIELCLTFNNLVTEKRSNVDLSELICEKSYTGSENEKVLRACRAHA
jgi:hypothetical protein